MTETIVAAAVAAAFVLVIVLTSGPRPKRARAERAQLSTVDALDRFGDDADYLFR